MDSALDGTAAASKVPSRRLRLDAPIVVLTCGRSGSTLLRFLLDAHPALACPAETGLIDLSMRMSVLSRLLDGPAANGRRELSKLGAKSIRNWVSVTFGVYLTQVGKVRWCDKSLGSADAAGKFLEIFPSAQFICLYRNCMDVVDSALEACPFGLAGYGLDPFAAGHPGNSVAAVADYWVCHTRAILRFEKAFPEACIRLRYEDLVTDPQGETARLFEFLGEDQVPGIAETCLTNGREAFGPSDHKIWMTSEIDDTSVGRGRRLPYRMIPPPVLAMVNNLLGQLGYSLIEDGWATSPPLAAGPVTRTDDHGTVTQQPEQRPASVTGPGGMTLDDIDRLLIQRVYEWHPEGEAPREADRQLNVIVMVPGSAAAAERVADSWQLDLIAGTVRRASTFQPRAEAHDRASPSAWGWSFVGDIEAFEWVISGQQNLASAMRAGLLRIDPSPSDEDSAAVEPSARVSLPLMPRQPRVKILSQLFRPDTTVVRAPAIGR